MRVSLLCLKVAPAFPEVTVRILSHLIHSSRLLPRRIDLFHLYRRDSTWLSGQLDMPYSKAYWTNVIDENPARIVDIFNTMFDTTESWLESPFGSEVGSWYTLNMLYSSYTDDWC